MIVVVIPCFKVSKQILTLIQGIGHEVDKIIVVDDCCPEKSGELVRLTNNSRVEVIFHKRNQGVGGAVLTGYKAALKSGATIIVKIDGDGQMRPKLINRFISPIIRCEADYTKGNRFYELENLEAMPKIRLIGNAILSFMNKLSSGYWDIFDPTNGFTAINAAVASRLPIDKISKRYFFESDMLFRLNTLRAVVVDVPMTAVYQGEKSSLRISKVIFEFSYKHFKNFIKRIFYNYYLRDMSLASIELPLGLILLGFGAIFGGWAWIKAVESGQVAPVGTVMLSALTILMGLQLVLAFLAYDIAAVPRVSKYRVSKDLKNNSGNE